MSMTEFGRMVDAVSCNLKMLTNATQAHEIGMLCDKSPDAAKAHRCLLEYKLQDIQEALLKFQKDAEQALNSWKAKVLEKQ